MAAKGSRKVERETERQGGELGRYLRLLTFSMLVAFILAICCL